ncbi:MAG: 2-isopropylmalate synthase [Candidatus Theseobacter exili]|nr:2-isopropylmalate synthase [Candidatus Theseobacter exili]
MSEQILVFDTTLRDGEQSPGASMNLREKMEVARQLVRLKVDAIEAGFPIASPGDFEAVQAIANEIRGPIIVGLARCMEKDIVAAAEALKKAERSRIHVFLATSKIHMEYKLKKAEAEILRQAVEGVKLAKKYVKDVEFSPEDASRSDPEFLVKVVEAVIDAGASTVNIPDTVGYSTPEEFGKLIAYLNKTVSNINQAVISVHCHNDLGLGVANSISAILNGARQLECTINGIGERAGNASLEEIVMILKTRDDLYKSFTTGIDSRQIMKTSRLVSNLTGIVVQPNKAIVGENAFAHEAGIHQDGVLKKQSTYEIMRPEDVGVQESKLVLGKHSGRHAFRDRLEHLGFDLDADEVNRAFDRFKVLADKKKTIYDEDLVALIEEDLSTIPAVFEMEYINICTGDKTVPTATVRLKRDGKILEDAATGDGPVDASYKAIDRITKLSGKLKDYSLKAVTGGKDALGEVVVKVALNNRLVVGKGTSTDILVASANAYLNAINRYLFLEERRDGIPGL